jgi:hypothetical protein
MSPRPAPPWAESYPGGNNGDTGGDLEGRVLAEKVEVVGILIPAGDGEDALAQEIRQQVRHLGGIAPVREGPGQRVDQAETLVGTGQQENAAVRTDATAIEGAGNLLLVDGWQGKQQTCIVVGGGHGRFCPRLESGVDTQSLSVSRQLYHALYESQLC